MPIEVGNVVTVDDLQPTSPKMNVIKVYTVDGAEKADLVWWDHDLHIQSAALPTAVLTVE